MRNIGNLFNLAEKRLLQEKKENKIPCYTELDVIEYAIKIRKFLDDKPKLAKKIMKLTLAEKRYLGRERFRRFYYKNREI